MAEPSAPAGASDSSWSSRAGSSAATGDVVTWLRRWRERLPEDNQVLPDDEARLVVEAVLEDMDGGRPENLDRAGRAWGRAHRSVSEMVGRLSSFREALAASGVSDPLRMHRALDRVTAGATEEVLHRLEHASRTDALTGVGNRRAFDETLSASLSAATRQGHDVTVVAVDLDGLKKINDSEGHAAGDSALLALVRAFYTTLRDEDAVFRVGGDEFVILLPFTSVGAAELLMERIQASGSPAFTWGAAGYPADGSDARTLVAAADQDLYRRREARRGGRSSVPRRAIVTSLRAEQSSAPLRWAWIPAAAVLVVSLIATLVSNTTGPSSSGVFARGGHHTTTPRTAAGHTPPTGGTTGANPPATAASGSARSTFLTASFTPTGSTGSTGSGSGNGQGSSGGGGTPPPTTSSNTGVLGLVSNLLSGVPLLGGNTGLVAVVGQVLTGPPPTVAAAQATSAPPTASGGLLGTVTKLLG